MKYFISLFFLSSIFASALAQAPRKPVQFSGIVIDETAKTPVPYASVVVPKTARGAICDARGWYSFVALEGDTVHFSGIGYKTGFAIVETAPTENTLSVVQYLEQDAIELKMLTILPFSTREEFRQMFMNTKVPDTDVQRLRDGLDRDNTQLLASKMGGMDGGENFRYYTNLQAQRYYYAGGQTNFSRSANGTPIPGTLLSPTAWAQFIQAVKRGDFKKKY